MQECPTEDFTLYLVGNKRVLENFKEDNIFTKWLFRKLHPLLLHVFLYIKKYIIVLPCSSCCYSGENSNVLIRTYTKKLQDQNQFV